MKNKLNKQFIKNLNGFDEDFLDEFSEKLKYQDSKQKARKYCNKKEDI